MRSKYCEYPEYHTSLDDLTLVTPAGLEGGYTALRRCIEVIESNRRWQVAVLGEPQLGKRGLFPSISLPAEVPSVKAMMNMIAYCDGTRDLVEVAELIGVPAWQLVPICERLASHDLLRVA
jgi:aminopeptidase-like protein